MNKEQIKQSKNNRYTLIVDKIGLLKYYFIDDEYTITKFITSRKLKFDEYVVLSNKFTN